MNALVEVLTARPRPPSQVKKFAEALEIIPRTLGENGGFNGSDVIAGLYAAHQARPPPSSSSWPR